MFDTVLVANRGEIAVRIVRTLRAHGIRSVAVYSDADAGAPHVARADVAVRLGPAPARESYLDVAKVVAAAVETGAGAIHPGYGFLAENPALARACERAGIVFVGPPAAAIEAMGDKIAAKATVAAAGVPVVPGSDGAGLDDDALAEVAARIGFPVLLKPSAGGGGKGMRLVTDPAELATAIRSARREARGAFGDDTLLVERFVTRPRHVEIQVIADAHGHVVHLGERECSLQRRHQKIVEEAPSVLLMPDVRAAMGRQAVEAARACGYVGAGTVEFIVSADRPDQFFFMEMNTRLQVEHPVTELVYGVDLVELQLHIAAGEPLPFAQPDLAPRGHAIEARVYAEDPDRGFLPTGGTVVACAEPTGDGIRVDSGIAAGTVVGSDYDPMLAKVVAWGADRAEALHRLDQALARTAVLGVTTNVGFLRRLLGHPDVVAGRLDTGLVERVLDGLLGEPVPDAAIAAAVLPPLVAARAEGDPWQRLVGWRHGGPATTRFELDVPVRGRVEVFVTAPVDPGGSEWLVRVGDGPPRRCRLDDAIVIDGHRVPVHLARVGRTSHVAVGGDGWTLTEVVSRGAGGDTSAGPGDGTVRSPMPGVVIAVAVAEGDEVVAGQTLVTVEAMKMEHALTAPGDGRVLAVHAPVSTPVALDQPLVTIEPRTEDQ